ncbi:MAG TPA: CPBP family intramembrane glutamic endopeptidase [Longimicrobium sp.]|jgi:membrane protease YdiL (CAAX protease family)
MPAFGSFVLPAALATAAVFIYYGVLIRWCGRLSVPLVDRLGLARHHPRHDAEAVLRLGVNGGSQALFLAVFLLLTGVPLARAIGPLPAPALVLMGVLLGVGEMGLAAFLSNAAVHALIRVAPGKVPPTMEGWLAAARGGWMREYLRAIEIASLPAAVVITAVYVSVEEIVFRGVLIPYLLPWGAGLAVAVSTLLFGAVQCIHTPSWAAALFPLVGALVMGTVHGLLFLAVPSIVPLVVAHLVFFFAAVL